MEISIIAICISIISPIINLILNEKIKSSVRHDFDKKIETFKSEIEVLKSKQNFKFTKLHEKRLEVLEETYKHLNELYYCLQSYLSPIKWSENFEDDPDKDWYLAFDKAYRNFFTYYSQKKIYYDSELEKLLEQYIKQTLAISTPYTEYLFLKNSGVTGKDLGVSSVKAMKMNPQISAQILPIKIKIEEKFREVLES